MKKLTLPTVSYRRVFFTLLFLVAAPLALFQLANALSAVSYEAEAGTQSGNISVTSDSTASGGNAIQYSASTGVGTVTIPSPGTWTNIMGNLSSVSNCDSWSHLFTPPSGSKLYVSLSCNHSGTGIYVSSGGSTWTKTGTGAGSADPNTMAQQMVFDPNNINNMWVSGIYGSTQNFASTDGGITFRAFDHGHSDGIGVDLTDPNHQTIVVGQHESRPTPMVFKSTNGGASFTSIASNLPSNLGFTQSPYVINSTTYLIAAFVSWSGGVPGIYRTTNGGTSWTKVADYNTFAHAFKAGNTLYWTDTNGGDGISRSTDNGVTWTHAGSGIKFETSAIGLPDGKLVAIPSNGNKLITSSDSGTTWTPFGNTLPCNPTIVAYSPGQDAFFVASGDCGNGVWKLK